jgi:hypothetical protein
MKTKTLSFGAEMKRKMVRVLGVVLCAILFTGCTVSSNPNEEYYELSTALTKLSRAVDGVVAYGELAEDTPEDKILEMAVEENMDLLEPFEDYVVHVYREGENSSVLVCTSDGKEALLEDAGCSGKLDRHAWQESPRPPCGSGLELSAICNQ